MNKIIILIQVIVLLFTQSLLAQPTKADTIHVSHYDINLEIRDFTKKEIKGYTAVTVEAKIAPLSSIYLHFWGLTVDSVRKGNSPINFLHQGQQLKIDLPFTSTEQSETIRIYYQGQPVQEQFGGFYFTDNFAYNMGVSLYSVPHSFGRVWFPCIDEFTDKSTYTFNITTDADKKAICGGILIDSLDLGDTKRWTWELSDPIPTYLASVAVGKYLVYKDTVNSISGKMLPIEIYADSARIGRVPGSFANLKTFIHTFEKRWGACRWQRVGYVVVPFSSGAMEHATNIAYPQFAVNGNTSNQDLIAHELAHSWFGNLITCATSKNMWINEGFARYGEYLCDEILDPSLQKYKAGLKSLHFKVLRSDNGLYALDNVPTSATYSSTSYDKGGLVAYTLRGYMGDDKYFSTITQFLDENQYKNVDSEEFFQKLSIISSIDLHDFFLGWVHQPGFLNFNIDSIKPVAGENNMYDVAFKQKLYLAHNFADNNLIDVEFHSAAGESYLIERILFSGEHQILQLNIPFEPVFWSIDPNSKMGDACFDYTQQLFKTGDISFSDGNFRISVDEISDTSVIRIEHNPVAPTPAKNIHPNIAKISEKHFWRVGFIQYNNMQATYSFVYNQKYDGNMLQGHTSEELVLLYRKDASCDWQIIPATITVTGIGTNISGRVSVNSILSGEYTLGIGKDLKINEWDRSIEIYPNPVADELRIKNYELRIDDKVNIYDFSGKIIIFNSQFSILNSINVSHLPTGTYILEVTSKENKAYTKFVKL